MFSSVNRAQSTRMPSTLGDRGASVGQDFGSSSSKISLAFNMSGSPHLLRVPFDQNGLRTPTPYELPSEAALTGNGELIVGKRAIAIDMRIALKTILTYVAGIRRYSVLSNLPGGVTLLQAVGDGRIDEEQMTKALTQHFQQLREAVVEVAENKGLELKALVLSYPSYLHSNEGEDDFDKYINTYIDLLRPIWGDIIIETANEGQAVGLYICERFEDPFSDVHRGLRNRMLFDGLSRAKGVNLVIVDIGSSTLNLQCVTVYFDEQNEMIKSQSSVLQGSVTGVQGGSGMSNDAVRTIIEERCLAALTEQGQLREGELAALLASFEEQKKELDYMHYGDVMHLRALTLCRTFPLQADDIVKVCRDAFAAPLAFLTTQLRQVAQLGIDFSVLLCGDSVGDVATASGIGMNRLFLRNERYSSSAVSGGLALSYARMPRPHEALDTSAIGVQEIHGRIGLDEAPFLFGKGSRDPPPCLVKVSPRKAKRLKLSLVCDPNYHEPESPAQPPSPLPIGPAAGMFTVTYDLGWDLSATELPMGTIAFTARGTRVNSSYEHIPFRLTYYKLKADETQAKHRKDRQWLLMLKTDPVTKLLVVGDTIKLPMWCSSCAQEISDDAWVCEVCKDEELCFLCYARVTSRPSRRDHSFTLLSMDSLLRSA
ncbi:hypothetical protein GQX73_g8729 [Xylaria multiplex]|uniref:Uncharacterized protein n=1 Tax=Xylaria multiplex TaxID=323545 RepID=A0A7C8MKR1_9PEZI|nr:hypothetical protein GQX73_g8729 [Xylaria multiplex]